MLSQAIRAARERGMEAKLYVGSERSGAGALDDCGAPTVRYWYRRTPLPVLTLASYGVSQLVLFARLLLDRGIPRDAVVYVNTLLPFGAALFGKLTGRRVMYHVHEASVSPSPLRALLVWIVRWTSSLNLYVSDAHRAMFPIEGVPWRRVFNALPGELGRAADGSEYTHRDARGRFRVLQISSLRDYKGIPELAALAERVAEVRDDIEFHLVVDADPTGIDRYFRNTRRPATLVVHPRQTATAPFYEQAGLVVNLSRVTQYVETFGLTVLEGMAFGRPVIVPPVGGPAELVRDGVEGFLVDSRDGERLREVVLRLADDGELCRRMSAAGRARAAEFSTARFAQEVTQAIASVTGHSP